MEISKVDLLDFFLQKQPLWRMNAFFGLYLLKALTFLISTPGVNITRIRQNCCVVPPTTYSNDVLAFQTLYKKWSLCKLYFAVVHTELTMMIISVTKHLASCCEEGRVVSSTTDVCNYNVKTQRFW
jgi:hypothetical protein